MSRTYYEESRRELINRILYLQRCNYVDFFRDSDAFILAICIAYFGLTEDVLIDKDSKNNDIKTRLSSCIERKYLKKMFDGDTGIIIRQKEKDGNSPEWFLSALRNGIFHQGPQVDYDEKLVVVDNDGPMNRLDCTVPFDWFMNYASDDVLANITVEDYNYTIFLNPFKKVDEVDVMNNNEDVVNFIENELIGYSIRFTKDDSHPNKNSVKRYKLIGFCNKMRSVFWRYLFDSDKLDDSELININSYRNLVESRLVDVKDNVSTDEYNKLFNNTLFSIWFEAEFKKKFSNYDVSISNFDKNNVSFNLLVYGFDSGKCETLSKSGRVDKRLFNTASKRKIFYKYTHPVFQRLDVASQLSSLVNYDKVDYVNSMRYLFEMYMMHKDFVVDNYSLTGFMKEILRSNRVPNHMEIEEMYAKKIDEEMKKSGLKLSYDKQIAEDLIRRKDLDNSDIHLRCREICKNYENIFCDECLFDVIALKVDFLDYFNDETLRREKLGYYSDQVLEAYDERNLYRLCNAKGVLTNQRDEVLIALLYTLGINTYVVNLETCYKQRLKEADYSFMDSLYFEGYSRKAAVNKVESESRKSNLEKKIASLNKRITDIQVGLEDSEEDEKNKKINLKEKWEKQLKAVTGKKEAVDELISYTEVRNFAGSGDDFGKTMNADCATIIRNCFAHGGRIFVESRESGGETNIVLTDYDENNKLSGIVRTNVTSLMQFFSHSVFQRIIDSNREEVSVVKKSK